MCIAIFQLSDLKLGLVERNAVLAELQGEAMSQEINARLMEANVQRRDMEVSFLRESHKSGVIRRSQTFAGSDFLSREVSNLLKCQALIGSF